MLRRGGQGQEQIVHDDKDKDDDKDKVKDKNQDKNADKRARIPWVW